jgi:uncharacterized glyoxalase superfamily protein PhnB
MTPNIFPVIRYKDAPGAIVWLSRAFGFVKQAEFANPDGTIAHAEVRLGAGMSASARMGRRRRTTRGLRSGRAFTSGSPTSTRITSVPDAPGRKS